MRSIKLIRMEPTPNQAQNSATKVIISIIVFLAVIIGVVVLAMSSRKEATVETPTDADKTPTPTDMPANPNATTSPTPNTPVTSGNTYKDGTYTANGTYRSPAGSETVGLSITLKDDIVTSVVVTPNATNVNSIKYQGQFTAGIAAQVIGKDIDSLAVAKVSGSSLTAGGFNDALVKIKAEARS